MDQSAFGPRPRRRPPVLRLAPAANAGQLQPARCHNREAALLARALLAYHDARFADPLRRSRNAHAPFVEDDVSPAIAACPVRTKGDLTAIPSGTEDVREGKHGSPMSSPGRLYERWQTPRTPEVSGKRREAITVARNFCDNSPAQALFSRPWLSSGPLARPTNILRSHNKQAVEYLCLL